MSGIRLDGEDTSAGTAVKLPVLGRTHDTLSVARPPFLAPVGAQRSDGAYRWWRSGPLPHNGFGSRRNHYVVADRSRPHALDPPCQVVALRQLLVHSLFTIALALAILMLVATTIGRLDWLGVAPCRHCPHHANAFDQQP